MSKGLSKYIASSGYFDKSLTVSSATIGGISIAPFDNAIGALVGKSSASFSFLFSVTTGIIKKLLNTIQNNNKKHNKIVMLARSKLNSIENKISRALMNIEISHKDFNNC